jgi:hypothetical protein
MTEEADIEAQLAQVFASIPLLFVREFLRQEKAKKKSIQIGVTQKDVRKNLRDALISGAIALSQLHAWLNAIEGWGRQHLYLLRVSKRSLTHAHLLNERALETFLTRKQLREIDSVDREAPAYRLESVSVDDEIVRLTWRFHGIALERREELDEVRELADGQYEFHAHRRTLKRSTSQLIVRKTNGVVLLLVDLPLGDEHKGLRDQILQAAKILLEPLTVSPVALEPIVRGLDEDAVEKHGPKPRRGLSLGIAPTQARFRAPGARVEFRSTAESRSYTDSDEVRRVRKAMQVERFVGEAGRFRLTFESEDRSPHVMVVSFAAAEGRMYLFSRMNEREMLSLVDHLLTLDRH